jgi:uncharacterized membrane protein YozB (DUF420 family)
MDQGATSELIRPRVEKRHIRLLINALVWMAIVALAVGFVAKYVFHYYLHYNAAAFDAVDPFWTKRGWLLLHITGGTLAILTGPWQFWTGLRQRHMRVHRWTGRLFLLGVGAGSVGAVYLAATTAAGWPFGVSLLGLAAAWLTTTGISYYAIRQGLVQIHKEWMIRAYVVTYAFVIFRVFNDYGPTSHILPEADRIVTIGWLSWVVPLGITEVILQLKHMRQIPRQSRA